jgi:hypothetical protein
MSASKNQSNIPQAASSNSAAPSPSIGNMPTKANATKNNSVRNLAKQTAVNTAKTGLYAAETGVLAAKGTLKGAAGAAGAAGEQIGKSTIGAVGSIGAAGIGAGSKVAVGALQGVSNTGAQASRSILSSAGSAVGSVGSAALRSAAAAGRAISSKEVQEGLTQTVKYGAQGAFELGKDAAKLALLTGKVFGKGLDKMLKMKALQSGGRRRTHKRSHKKSHRRRRTYRSRRT